MRKNLLAVWRWGKATSTERLTSVLATCVQASGVRPCNAANEPQAQAYQASFVCRSRLVQRGSGVQRRWRCGALIGAVAIPADAALTIFGLSTTASWASEISHDLTTHPTGRRGYYKRGIK